MTMHRQVRVQLLENLEGELGIKNEPTLGDGDRLLLIVKALVSKVQDMGGSNG